MAIPPQRRRPGQPLPPQRVIQKPVQRPMVPQQKVPVPKGNARNQGAPDGYIRIMPILLDQPT